MQLLVFLSSLLVRWLFTIVSLVVQIVLSLGQLLALFRRKKHFLPLQLATASQQINHYDCGVYAIAFATALMFDTDPSKITFDSQNMRQHLLKCFTWQNLISFPSLNLLSPFQEKLQAQIVQVYCLCRRPLRFRLGKIPTKEEKLTQCESCNDCFHRSCLPSGEIFKVKKWRCQKCVNIWISLLFYGFFFIMNNYFCIFSQFLIVLFWPSNKIQARVHTNTVIDLSLVHFFGPPFSYQKLGCGPKKLCRVHLFKVHYLAVHGPRFTSAL